MFKQISGHPVPVKFTHKWTIKPSSTLTNFIKKAEQEIGSFDLNDIYIDGGCGEGYPSVILDGKELTEHGECYGYETVYYERPTITLIPGIEITDGTGTSIDPYEIVLND